MADMSNPHDENPYGPANQPNPYGGPAYPQPHPQGTTVLVLGIIGLVVCFIPGIVGLVIGNKAMREIDANPAAYNNRPNVVAGRILAIIGIVWQVLVIAVYSAIVVIAIAASP